jgi:hypothetical protein
VKTTATKAPTETAEETVLPIFMGNSFLQMTGAKESLTGGDIRQKWGFYSN